MTRVCGAKRLGLKIEAKRLGGERPGGKCLGGETSWGRNVLLPLFRVISAKKHFDPGHLGPDDLGFFF